MRTLAHALIQRRYAEMGLTTRFVTLPLAGSGLPDRFVEGKQPVSLDILAGRPVNLSLDQDELGVDLCFEGPPVRCTFPWEAIIAAQDASGDLVQTTVVTVATVMEDGTLVARPIDESGADAPLNEEAPGTPKIAVLDGGGHREETNEEATQGVKPRLQLVDTDDPDA